MSLRTNRLICIFRTDVLPNVPKASSGCSSQYFLPPSSEVGAWQSDRHSLKCRDHLTGGLVFMPPKGSVMRPTNSMASLCCLGRHSETTRLFQHSTRLVLASSFGFRLSELSVSTISVLILFGM